jgi:CheY-like chemotaxis protein
VTRARTQPLVLLAEDFEDARELYRDYLEFSGFTVHTASNGREAIDQAVALLPDLILMDASMPVLEGLMSY